MDRVDPGVAGRDAGEPGGEDSSLERLIGILALPHEVDRNGPVREALLVQAHRISRPGKERTELEAAFLRLIGMKDSRLVLPHRGVRLCRALRIGGTRQAEEAARREGILPFHGDDVLDRAGEELLRAVSPLIRTPRRVARTARRLLKRFPVPKGGVVDGPTLRFIRRLGTGVRAKRRGSR